MDLWDSAMRVMWDPDDVCLVLVPYGAPMWDRVKVDGSQQVQTAGAIRRRGVRNHPRANESHQIDFTLGRVKDSVREALEANFADALALPRSMKDVLLSFAGGKQFRVRNCAVQSWPHDHEDQVCRQTVRILGGEMVSDDGVYEEGEIWGGYPEGVPADGLLTEVGDGLLTEDGVYLVTE